MKICIVSPHIDDAVLSCGIFIQRRVAAGDEILVVDIFTKGKNDTRRANEEKEAMARIGATGYILDEFDAPDRDPRYKSTKELFLGDMKDVPENFLAHVTQRLETFFREHGIGLAVFPLAAGTHIDHRIAHEAGRRIKSVPVKYYEDRPYILWPGILQGRMNEIGSDAVLPRVSREQMEGALGDYYYLTHFVPADRRHETLPMYLAALDVASSRKLKATSETLVATESELKAMYHSLAAYESQMVSIYPDYDTFIRDSLSYEKVAGHDAYTERSWTFA
jgi:LmbE family N-acetylglucosaminyl deacetylase